MQEIKEAVFKAVSNLFNISTEDLTASVEDKTLESTDDLIDALRPIAKTFFNTKHDEYVNKGYRQASKKTERAFKKHFEGVNFDGKTQEELFEELKTLMDSKPTKDRKKVTLQEALQSEEVQSHFANLKQYESKYAQLENEFDSYKNLMSVKSTALNVLTQNGANFSSDANIRKRQEKAFLSELKQFKYDVDSEGKISILDNDGEKMFNKNTGNYWDFSDFVKQLSPVDFQEQKQDKKISKPNVQNWNGTQYGFSKENLKSVSFDDYNNALQSGDTEKAKFLYDQMIKNYENNV